MMVAPKQLQIKAPAKVNLCLRVVGKRSDGYHLLQMVNVPLGLADELTIALVDNAALVALAGRSDCFVADGVAIQSESTDVPLDEQHLCYRAAQLMRREAGHGDCLHIQLLKRIPVSAGLGGGSSDAASVLLALDRMWGLGWALDRFASVGERLGADVPFFCCGQPAIVEGIGEQLRPCGQFPNIPILLVNPNIAVSTQAVFEALEIYLTQREADATFPPLFETFEDVTAVVANDLESVTISRHPVIRDIKSQMVAQGADVALMSGSGATVFGLFRDEAARDRAYVTMSEGTHWVCKTEILGVGKA